jgi:hypothetical protein
MMVIEDLLMQAISIVIQQQHSLNSLYQLMKDEFQFRPLNFTQEVLNANEILWPEKLLSCQYRVHVLEKPEVRSRKVPSQDCKMDKWMRQKVIRL